MGTNVTNKLWQWQAAVHNLTTAEISWNNSRLVLGQADHLCFHNYLRAVKVVEDTQPVEPDGTTDQADEEVLILPSPPKC